MSRNRSLNVLAIVLLFTVIIIVFAVRSKNKYDQSGVKVTSSNPTSLNLGAKSKESVPVVSSSELRSRSSYTASSDNSLFSSLGSSKVSSSSLQKKSVAEASCAVSDFNKLSFYDYVQKLKEDSTYCGGSALKVSDIERCLAKDNSNNYSNDLGPECNSLFLRFLDLKTKDQNADQPQKLSDKILAALIVKSIFSGEGFKKEGAKKIVPLLYEMLNRDPDNIGLLRVFVMLKATSLLFEPLDDKDKETLDKVITFDFADVNTRNAVVTIYTNQKGGFSKISQLIETYPKDIYSYASLAGASLEAEDKETALEWAQYGLKKNPGSKQFLALNEDIKNGTFDIRKYYDQKYDISSMFRDTL